MDMQDCRFFTCYFFWTLGSSSRYSLLSLFYGYYFGRCLSELTQLVPFAFSRGSSTHYSGRQHDCSVTIPRYCNYVYVNSFFLFAARLNSLPLECFRITESHFEIKNMQMRHHYQNTSAEWKINTIPPHI